MKPIEIFKAGTHPDKNGNKHTITVADLEETARVYNPQLHEAPFVIGHPQDNHPAYGWAASLSVEGDSLIAHPQQVNSDFAEWVESGALKKRSSSFYPPNSPNNPVPNCFYLRHVGFLGAQPPAIKGLKDVSFAEGEDCIEFSESSSYAFRTLASVLSRLRDFFIVKEGLEKANDILSPWEIDYLRDLGNEDPTSPSFSEAASNQPTNNPPPASTEVPPASSTPEVPPVTQEGEEVMSEQDKARLAALETENAALKASAQKAEAEAIAQANTDFAEGLIKEGKLLPKGKDKVIALLNGAPVTADFAEGGKSYADELKALFSGASPVINFSEVASKDAANPSTEADTIDYAEGTPEATIDLDKKIRGYMAEHKVDYKTAFAAVKK